MRHLNVSIDWLKDQIERTSEQDYAKYPILTASRTKDEALAQLDLLKKEGLTWVPQCNDTAENGACNGHGND